jgi:signal transduction histidine kinase
MLRRLLHALHLLARPPLHAVSGSPSLRSGGSRVLLPTALVLGGVLLALAWGLVSLERIFLREREEAHAALRTRRASLEQYAEEAFRQALTRQLDRYLPALEAARLDPLQPDTGLYLRVGDEQLLPRQTPASAPPGAEDAGSLRARYEALRAGRQAGEGEAWQGRVGLLRQLEAALARRERPRAEALLRELVSYSNEVRLPPAEELTLLVYLVERLESAALLPPAQVRAMVRGQEELRGGAGRPEEGGEGLQRVLLKRRAWLSPADLAFLAERVTALSERMAVSTSAFRERLREASAARLVVPASLAGPSLVGGSWLLEPLGGGGARGVAVDPEDVARRVEDDMLARGLLPAGARVAAPPPTASLVPLEAVRLAVTLPAWEVEAGEVDARFRLKTGLALASCALTVAIVAFGLLEQARRQRFLTLKSDFVATVSHELRTPLASIRLLAETLEHRLGGLPEARDYPARLVREAEDLSFLVENVLSYNRLARDRWRPQVEAVRVADLAAALRRDAAQLPAPTELAVEGEEVELLVDPELLRLVLSNLARNAYAYSRRRPVQLALRARAAPHPTLLFSDNGIGIPEAEWENVFTDFYRLNGPGREARGSGLGLAICRHVMALHGGSIHVATSGPQGTTFALMLPAPTDTRARTARA